MWYCRAVAENETEEKPYWIERPKKQKRGSTLNIRQTMTVFFAWLHAGRNATRTSELTGISVNGVCRLVNHGKKQAGIPPFKEMAQTYEASGLMFLPTAADEALRHYKWSRRKAVAQTLQICEGLRKQVRDAVLSGELKIRTPEDAAKCAQAIKQLEESVGTVAVAMNLVDGEVPAPKKASPEKPKADDVKQMDEDELRKRAGADVVPIKEAG